MHQFQVFGLLILQSSHYGICITMRWQILIMIKNWTKQDIYFEVTEAMHFVLMLKNLLANIGYKVDILCEVHIQYGRKNVKVHSPDRNQIL